ncbi:hypothetical protein C2134_20285 [Chromobacterium sinusclupearum]|uniref:Uncharacterized protein n=1 Tax=Chromobacterium sinusclupearum TaxID=2077146 RepID=A0A2K4MJI2_9NEIS|nr:hypothetical protein [Chromobacterium sinusclupearum]POA96885.1 hypothetical protein C2134_20285 [Chromobacterium sinusclupearum]
MMIAIAPALIGIFASLITAYAGQKTTAYLESEKIIRTNLEDAYNKTLQYDKLATELNMAAFPNKNEVQSNFAAMRYNNAIENYNKLLNSTYALIDIYGDNIEAQSSKLKECSKEYVNSAADMFIMNLQIYKITDFGTPAYKEIAGKYKLPEKQNQLVAIRLNCTKASDEMRDSIKREIKSRLTHSIL